MRNTLPTPQRLRIARTKTCSPPKSLVSTVLCRGLAGSQLDEPMELVRRVCGPRPRHLRDVHEPRRLVAHPTTRILRVERAASAKAACKNRRRRRANRISRCDVTLPHVNRRSTAPSACWSRGRWRATPRACATPRPWNRGACSP